MRRTYKSVCSLFVFLLSFTLSVSAFGADPVAHGAGSIAQSPHKVGKRSLPPANAVDFSESERIKQHSSRNWRLMAYPSDRIPSQPFTEAREWVRKNVPDSEPWPLANKNLSSMAPLAVTPPGTAQWVPFGPTPLDSVGTSAGFTYGKTSGRVNAIAVDPLNSAIAYAGTASGGLWKSENIGSPTVTWTPLFDTDDVVTQAVGAIEIDPNNNNIVYVGTGDFNASDQHGEGFMKSTDAGLTWTQLGANVFTPFAAGTPLWANQNTGAVKVDPNNSNNILVGTRFELFISHDAGVNWERCAFGVNPTDPTGTVIDGAINRISGIVLDSSTNPTTAYVAVGYHTTAANGNNGVYKGTIPANGCPALNISKTGGWPANTGNGTNGGSDIGRIRLTSSRGNGTNNFVVYAHVQDTDTFETKATFVTTNQGATWNTIGLPGGGGYEDCNGQALTFTEDQDWYDLYIAANPSNDKTVYIGRVNIYKATVNSTYTQYSAIENLTNVYETNCPSYGVVHPDQHTLAFLDNTGDAFLAGNDGGVYYNDAEGALGGWKQLNDGINTIQFYAGQIGPDFASGGLQLAFGGTQDNGTMGWDSGISDFTWLARGNGGDGFFSAFDHIAGTINSGRWYAENPFGTIDCSTNGAAGSFNNCAPSYTGERPDWSAPFLIDPYHCTNTSCGNMLLASSVVYAGINVDAAADWIQTGGDLTKGDPGTIISLNLAPNEPKTGVVGTFDGNVQWSNNVFTGGNCTEALSNTAGFACAGNATATWVNLTQANAVLPNRAIMGVAIAPDNHQVVYAAIQGFDDNTPLTPGHVFRASCTTACTNPVNWTWVNKSGNLPDVPANSVIAHPDIPEMVFLGTDAGFFYTKDITVVNPVWERYTWGLPNTKVQHLTIDRGNTTLAAFTYGRGLYAITLPPTDAGFCEHPGKPAGLTAAVTIDNQVDLTWTASSPAATSYNIYRTTGSCPGSGYELIASGVVGTAYQDTTVSGGSTYSYKVSGVNGTADCESKLSSCDDATATGACTQAPTFAGITSASNPGASTCTVDLTWSAASSNCSGSINYNIYRSTTSGFTPSGANQIATGISGTNYSDTDTLTSATRYYYVVRAVDTANSSEDTNTVETSGRPYGPPANGTFTAGAETADFDMTMNSPWSIGSAQVHTGSNAYGSGYTNNTCAALVTPSMTLTNAQTSTMTFWTGYDIETDYDGGVLEVSTNGGTSWTKLTPSPDYPSSFITSTDDACGYGALGGGPSNRKAFMGENLLTYVQETVNLAAFNGQTVLIRWNFSTDQAVAGSTGTPGWFVDDISITNAQIPSACTPGGPCTPPGAPVITSVTDVSDCAQSGVQVNYTAGSSATSHDLYVDGNLAVSNYASGATYNPGNTSSHSYVVRAKVGSCSTNSNSMNGTDANTAPPAPSITVTDVSGCAVSGVQITFTQDGTATYDLWVDGNEEDTGISTGHTYMPGNSTSHNYVVRINKNGCSSDSSTHAVVDANNTPAAPTITATDVSSCALSGVSITFTQDGAATYDLWVDGSQEATGISSGHTYSPGDSASHSYVVRMNKNGCSSDSGAQAATDANNTPTAPTITVSDVSACATSGVTISFTADGGATYDLWVDGSQQATGISSGHTYSPGNNSSHSYVVRMNKNGCSSDSGAQAATDVNNTPAAPTITVTDADSCADSGVEVNFTAVGGVTYDLYVDGSEADTGISSGHVYVPGDSASHDYKVRAFQNSCSNDSSTHAVSDVDNTPAAPSITVSDVDACAGDGVEITFTADGGATYDLWVDGSEEATGITTGYIHSPGDNASHDYVVRIHKNGCSNDSDSEAATDVNNAPAAPVITVSDVSVCALTGVQIAFTAAGGATYDLWVDGSEEATGITTGYVHTPGDGASHDYVVRVNQNGCSNDSTTHAEVDAIGPTAPTITATDVSACASSGVQIGFTAEGGATYDLWVDGTEEATGISNGHVYSPGDNSSHSYVVRINKDGCSSDSGAQPASDANGTPAAPTITSITDESACAQSGIRVNFGTTGATSYNLLRGGITVVTGYSSGDLYNPADSASHTYSVQAVSGACSATSTTQDATDATTTITLDTDNPTDGTINQVYGGFTFTATGGTGTYTFSSTGLPDGMTVEADGDLSGTPTESGSFNVNVIATDGNSCTGNEDYVLEIGTAPTCLFCDDFEDGVVDVANWIHLPLSGTWSEDGDNLVATVVSKKATALAQPGFVPGCQTCTVNATLQTAGGAKNRIWLFGWYVDKSNRMELLMKEETNVWLLKQRTGNFVVAKKKTNLFDIVPGTPYNVSISYNGTQFEVKINGTQAILLTPVGTVPTGTVGFQVKATTARIAEIVVN